MPNHPRRYLLAAALVLATLGAQAPVQAGMLGDTLKFERLFPDLDTNFDVQPITILATAGSSDQATLQNHELFDPEDTSISIDWTDSSTYIGNASVFDGFRISGFSGTITNVTATDVQNINLFGIGFSDHFITLNFSGPFSASSFVNLTVDFAPVPVPNSILLFGPALIGALGLARRRKA